MKTPLVHVYNELKYRNKVSSKADFGKQLGYTRTYFSQVMNGIMPLTDNVIDKIATLFDVDRDFITSGKGLPFKATIIQDNLKLIRFVWDITQEELGALIGATRGMIMQYENTDRNTTPPSAIIDALTAITGLASETLLTTSLTTPDIPNLTNELKLKLRAFKIRKMDNNQPIEDSTPSLVAEEAQTYGDKSNPVVIFDTEKQTINNQYFSTILPTISSRNKWIPYFNSVWNFIKQYPNTETLMKDKTQNFWPMTPLPDEMLRMPGTIAHFVIPAPADNNMYPAIKPCSPISIMYTDTDDITWGIAHLVVFNDNRYSCYYLKPGDEKEEWWGLSQNDLYDKRKIKIKNVRAVFEIIDVLNSRPGL